MLEQTIKEHLIQGTSEESADLLKDYLRGAVRLAFFDLMEEEVQTLCGVKHHPDEDNGYRRAGSEQGRLYLDGEKETIRRPRVRRKTKSGAEAEVNLKTYAAGRNTANLQEKIGALLLEGVSTRGASRLSGQTVSKSTISDQWAQKSAEKLVELSQRPLKKEGYIALMLDGVHLSKDICAIVALGISEDGSKKMLDFQVGSSENSEVANDLLKGLKKRGFKPRCKRLLVVLDGSEALAKSVRHHYRGKAVMQRCLVHKERNLKGYLSHKHHGKLEGYFKRLRQVEGLEAAQEVLQELEDFLRERNAAALESLLEAGEDLIALHRLGVPATLHPSLLSTNLIENSILNIRRKMNRVTRWRTATKAGRESMAERYLASGVLYAESTFRRIRGCRHLEKLLSALQAT